MYLCALSVDLCVTISYNLPETRHLIHYPVDLLVGGINLLISCLINSYISGLIMIKMYYFCIQVCFA